MTTVEKKKKETAPPPRFQDSWDAKVTTHTGPFILWALRPGEEKPCSAAVLIRKGEATEKGFSLTVEEIPLLRALLDHFEKNLMSRLNAYGVATTEVD